ncbi:hypothetical protein JDV02_004270 [Purpureocillium takamizusanense]|uniref:Uncharacterized protein n=1 Tax=Purpureocillium takamizusanense TaxID=2060973 RepID=A0A9Q8QEW2_9HYPO|nr:uncharacterized protein JDV02_004270 [Purpureocillium takamizusanense]UNI17967.1 hypothetical protein JDV02_004270 [Purpureocillium takamizusanense]
MAAAHDLSQWPGTPKPCCGTSTLPWRMGHTPPPSGHDGWTQDLELGNNNNHLDYRTRMKYSVLYLRIAMGCKGPAAARGPCPHAIHASQAGGAVATALTTQPPCRARPPRDAAAAAAFPGQEPCIPTGCTDPAPHQLAMPAIGRPGAHTFGSVHPSRAFDPSLRPAPPAPGHLTSPAARTLLCATRS